MYEDRKETFSIKDLFLQLLFIVLLVFILIWLFPTKGYLEKKLDGIQSGMDEKLKPLYTRLFTDNILTMKEAAKSYFTTPRLPQNVGDTVKMTLAEMYDKALLLELVDSNNNACDANKSYVELTKKEEEYELKVTLSCSDKEAYVIEYLGCYDYCEGTICSKKEEHEYTGNKKYRYKYVLTVGGTCSGYGSWSNWKTSKIEENSNTKVETKTVSEVVDTIYKDVKYLEDVHYGYSTRTIKRTTNYEYDVEETTKTYTYDTVVERHVTPYDYIVTKTLVDVKWIDQGVKKFSYPPVPTATTKYVAVANPSNSDCGNSCLEDDSLYYRVYKAENVYSETKKCPEVEGITDTGTGCIVATDVTVKKCTRANSRDTGSGCVVTETVRSCKRKDSVDTGSGCAVVEYYTQQYCAANGKDTGSGCVVQVEKTKTVAELVYKNVTYYRSATRECTSSRTDYQWSTSNADASLKAKGYTLTGDREEI